MSALDYWIDFKDIANKRRLYDEEALQSGTLGYCNYFSSFSGQMQKLKSIYACSKKDCYEKVYARCCYHYITGRAGRVSYAERYYCKVHTEKFAKAHKIEIPKNEEI